jgi:hypothetical protein
MGDCGEHGWRWTHYVRHAQITMDTSLHAVWRDKPARRMTDEQACWYLEYQRANHGSVAFHLWNDWN